MSKVESVKTLISASASGAEQRAEHAGEREVERALDLERRERPLAAAAFVGTLRAAHTSEVSVAVAVTENSEDDSAHCGHLGARGRAGRPRASRGTARG